MHCIRAFVFFNNSPYICIKQKTIMSDDILDNNETTDIPEKEAETNYKPASPTDKAVKYQLSGMYQNWFLDYASYVILERAVPHINDGLKPCNGVSCTP